MAYDRDATKPAADFHDVGDIWTDGVASVTPLMADLATVAGDAGVDTVPEASIANPNDIEAEV